jgi:hypothetical protein
MTKTRVQLLVLGALVLAGGLLVYRQWPASDVTGAGSTAPGTAGAPAAGAESAVGDLRLELLEERENDRYKLGRDLFRFRARPAPVAPRQLVEAAPPVPTGPLPPPPPPPIPLRFIGYVDQAHRPPRVAVLSDGRGNIFHGREGDIIEGRYRVLRVGVDSAELMYVDGRGRQTIRLSGQ